MMNISTFHNPDSRNGVCYELMGKNQQGEKNFTLNWYVDDRKDIHFEFCHVPEMTDIKILQDDGLFYAMLDDLYAMLQYMNSIEYLQKDPVTHSYKFESIVDTYGTPNSFVIDKLGNSFYLHFNEFSTDQTGFTEIIISNSTDKAYYACLSIALQEFDNQYQKEQENKSNCKIKQYADFTKK